MDDASGVRRDAAAPSTSDRCLLVGLHAVAAAVVVVGVTLQVWRPLAPDLGAPPAPSTWFDTAHLARVGAYRLPLYAAGIASLGVRLLVVGLAAFSASGRSLTDRIVRRVGWERPALAGATVVLVVVVMVDLAVLPLQWWAGYVHEGAFGFRTQGLGGWIFDWAVTTIPLWLGGWLLAFMGFTVARRLPRAWPPVAGLGGGALAGALVFVSPLVLEPLVFDTQSLPPGPLRTEVQSILERAGEPVERIVVADASRRTTKRNAYVSGLGASRRVVLYDTLVGNQPPEEVGVVLAHEIGHDQHADLLRGTVLAASGMIVLAYLLAGVATWRRRRGSQDEVADPRAAAVVLAVVVVAATLSMPVQTAVSRRAEAAADLAALQLTRAPVTYMRKTHELARANLSDPLPPPWVHLLWSTHPPVSARLQMGRWWQEEVADR